MCDRDVIGVASIFNEIRSYRKLSINTHTCEKGVSGCVCEEKKSINSTLVTMCEKGVSGGGVNIKDPVPLYIMECEWGV